MPGRAAVSAVSLVPPSLGSATEVFERRPDFARFVPADKRLSKEWVDSLFVRGQPAVYSGEDLAFGGAFIGMPVSGITTGQLYLGGDGRLWLWDIFNETPSTLGEHYAQPLLAFSTVDQGFTLRISRDPSSKPRPLASGGFENIAFRGEYPIGYVDYRDPARPLRISREAFSPSVPLDVNDSSLPATVLQFTITNTSTAEVNAELTGMLENAVARSANNHEHPAARTNTIERNGSLLFLNLGADVPDSESRPDAGISQ
jgi:hypothetical protein